MVEVHGFCDARFAALEEAFRANFDEGLDRGAALAVALHGEPVVDLWAGWRDHELQQPWAADTIVRVFSTTKIVVIIPILMLVDRGMLDLDAPIATYWPEFANNGKGAVTARQVLVHRAGLPGFGRPVTNDEIADWAYATTMLESAPLWYEPGTVSCYHFSTFGQILGEVVQRVSGVPFYDFVHRELTGPLDVDFHFARRSPADRSRVSALWPPEEMPVLESAIASAALAEQTTFGDFSSAQSLGRAAPGGTGICDARGLARIGAVVAAGGEVDGRRYLSRAVIDEAVREHSFAVDELFGTCRYGLGLGLHSDEYPAPTPTTAHWGGLGGAFVTMDVATGVSCGFAPNRMIVGDSHGSEPRQQRLWAALGEVSAQLG